MRFWPLYPRRNGKKAGRKKAREEWDKLTSEEKDKAVTAIPYQVGHYDACKAIKVFVAEFPDAHRWLRDRRFNDEVGEIPTHEEKDPLKKFLRGEV